MRQWTVGIFAAIAILCGCSSSSALCPDLTVGPVCSTDTGAQLAAHINAKFASIGGGGSGTVSSATGPQIGQYGAGTSTTIGGVTMSGDGTIAQGGALSVTKSGGNLFTGTAFGASLNLSSLLTGDLTVTGAGVVTSTQAAGAFNVIGALTVGTAITVKNTTTAGVTGAVNFSFAGGAIQTFNQTGNTTATLTGLGAGNTASRWYVCQDATGSRTLTFTNTIQWSGGVAGGGAPAHTATASRCDEYSFYSPDGTIIRGEFVPNFGT